MSSVLIHECDICKKHEVAKSNDIPTDWLSFEYEFVKDKAYNSVTYSVCSIECYLLQVDRCLHWAASHSEVLINGMSRLFTRKLLSMVNIKLIQKKVDINFLKSQVEDNLEVILEGSKQVHENEEQNDIDYLFTEKDDSFIPIESNNILGNSLNLITHSNSISSTKIHKIVVSSDTKLEWLEAFASETSNERTMYRMSRLWEEDNITHYDILIDKTLPQLPLIRYMDRYIIFVSDSDLDKFRQLKLSNLKNEENVV